MARERRNPEDLVGELTADERRELAAALAAAEQAEEELEEAPPGERSEAREELEEAEQRLRAAYERAGLTYEQGEALREVVAAETTRSTEAAVRRVLEEYDVRVAEEDDDPASRETKAKGGGRASSLGELQKDPAAEPVAPAKRDKEPETPPEKAHWFHRDVLRKEGEPDR